MSKDSEPAADKINSQATSKDRAEVTELKDV